MTNTGTISAVGGYTFTVFANGGIGSVRFDNSGSITGANYGVQLVSDSAVYFANSGTITAYEMGVVLDGPAEATNTRLIIGTGNAAFVMGYGGTLFNAGVIRSDVDVAIRGTYSVEITNTGEIDGRVAHGDDADILSNSGIIRGLVDMADGTDTYDGRGGTVIGEIRGGDGNATLNGGAEADTLIGGRGEDVFLFSYGDSGTSNTSRDIIRDFTRKVDLLDFSAIADIAFIGTNGFSGAGTAEIRFKSKNGSLRLSIDENGNGNTDMQIDLLGVTQLSGNDFVL